MCDFREGLAGILRNSLPQPLGSTLADEGDHKKWGEAEGQKNQKEFPLKFHSNDSDSIPKGIQELANPPPSVHGIFKTCSKPMEMGSFPRCVS
jgi:hypothetical protein